MSGGFFNDLNGVHTCYGMFANWKMSGDNYPGYADPRVGSPNYLSFRLSFNFYGWKWYSRTYNWLFG